MRAERRADGLGAAGEFPDAGQQVQQSINRGTLVGAVRRHRGHQPRGRGECPLAALSPCS